jgi:spore coat polysaccharide biosynthesis protein SpsF
MRPRNVAVVQARMGSSRFPGKMLAPLGGRPVLEWVIRRLRMSSSLAQIVLATSDCERDVPLVELAARLGVAVFRGSESDVLGRFVGAAQMARADNVIRVCADNPFIDPVELDRLTGYFADNPCDYACNHQERLGNRYADGFGAEMLSAALLREIAVAARESRHREHVTLYLWDHASQYRLCAVPPSPDLAWPELRFDVDVPEDLERLETLVQAGVTIDTSAADIIRIARFLHRSASADFSDPRQA